MIDLNKFKSINDTYGHHLGDKALAVFAAALRKVQNRAEISGRFGGDEFVFVGMHLSREQQDDFRRRLESALENEISKATLPCPITFSIGFQVQEKGKFSTYEQLVSKADSEMYREKSTAQ